MSNKLVLSKQSTEGKERVLYLISKHISFKVVAPGVAGSNNFVYILSKLSHIIENTLNLWLYLTPLNIGYAHCKIIVNKICIISFACTIFAL